MLTYVVLTIVTLCLKPTVASNGVMLSKDTSDEDWKNNFCFSYNPSFHPLPSSREDANATSLVDLSSSFGCLEEDYFGHNVKGQAVIIARGNCSFVYKAQMAQKQGAATVLVASQYLLVPSATNETDYKSTKPTIALITWETVYHLQTEGPKSQILLYAPSDSFKLDPNMLVLFLIAVSCVSVGGCWAGVKRYKIFLRKKKALERKPKTETEESVNEEVEHEDEENNVNLSVPVIVVFFLLVCGFLVLLYFFYDYLVFVVIVLFCLAGSMGLYFCIQPLWIRLLPFNNSLPVKRMPCFKSVPEYRNILLAVICMAVAIFWAIQRHETYAWVFQNILGFCFCVNVMCNIHMPNIKVCTIALVLLFLYDIFFVFITPLFTSNHESIMVKVATGGSGSGGGKPREQLPMAFIVPKLLWEDINICMLPYSLLGFGDIVVPSLLVCHNHAFDLKVGSRKIYFISTVVAYAMGLLLTFGALAIMQKGQPALLYIVPCTLLTTYVIGWLRGELKLLWTGLILPKPDKDQENPTDGPENQPERAGAGSETSISSVSDGEGQQLLRH